jgi:putative restriction endonuclease
MTIAGGGRDDDRRLGEIPGVDEGRIFADRTELAEAGVHRQNQAGITGSAEFGAESIVLSGGYADVDTGRSIIYTGHGGRNRSGKQVSDQTFDNWGNAALKTSMIRGTPVRVSRGRGKNRREREHIFNPPLKGYRYDGLYFVADCYYEKVDGLRLCRFAMYKALEVDATRVSMDLEVAPEQWHGELPLGNPDPGRRTVGGTRTVRSAEVSDKVKKLYDYTCQVCHKRLDVSGRGFAQGAHIQGVGRDDDGPDVPENILCLCPNCHVLFDYGAILIGDDYSLTCNGRPAGNLLRNPRHRIGKEYVDYHRKKYAESNGSA